MFYTYLWLREDGTPYYVGKGSKNRAYTSHAHSVHRPVEIERIVIYPAESEVDAFETEIALIWYYGRKALGTGVLRNLTDGGENPPKNFGKRSEETCKRISQSLKGVVSTEEHKEKIRSTLKSRVIPKYVRDRMLSGLRTKLVGRPKVVSEETRKKISATLMGKPGHKSTEETNQKIRVKALERYAKKRELNGGRNTGTGSSTGTR